MTDIGNNSAAQLRSIIDRVENLNEQIKALQEDRKEIYTEAKGNGYDPRAIKAIVRKRAEDAGKRAEIESLVEAYEHALGFLSDLPLGQAAIEAVRRA